VTIELHLRALLQRADVRRGESTERGPPQNVQNLCQICEGLDVAAFADEVLRVDLVCCRQLPRVQRHTL